MVGKDGCFNFKRRGECKKVYIIIKNSWFYHNTQKNIEVRKN